jgi:hypothetical protein
MMMKHRVRSLTTGRVLMGTQQAVTLHRRNVAEDKTGMTKICETSSAAEMHAAGLKTGIRSMSTLNRSSVKKGTMTTMVPRRVAQCRRSQGFFPRLEEGALALKLQTVRD